MATALAAAAPPPRVQIPCKLVFDCDFEDPYLTDANKLDSPPNASPCSKRMPPCAATSDKRQRRAGRAPKDCTSPRKRTDQDCTSPRKRTKNVDRRVRFRPDTKKYDGLHEHSEALEHTVWRYYTLQTIKSVDDILSVFKTKPKKVFNKVCSAVKDLTDTLGKSSCDATVPVLPQGGGRGLLLGKSHMPTFKQLRDMFLSAETELEQFC